MKKLKCKEIQLRSRILWQWQQMENNAFECLEWNFKHKTTQYSRNNMKLSKKFQISASCFRGQEMKIAESLYPSGKNWWFLALHCFSCFFSLFMIFKIWFYKNREKTRKKFKFRKPWKDYEKKTKKDHEKPWSARKPHKNKFLPEEYKLSANEKLPHKQWKKTCLLFDPVRNSLSTTEGLENKYSGKRRSHLSKILHKKNLVSAAGKHQQLA